MISGRPIRVCYFDLAVCGVSTRFIEAYILNCAALRSAFCLASPSGNCFASLARASACSSRRSAVKNTTFVLLRFLGIMSVSLTFFPTNRAVRIAMEQIQFAFDRRGRSFCSAASNARAQVAKP